MGKGFRTYVQGIDAAREALRQEHAADFTRVRRRKRYPYGLTYEDVAALWKAQNGRCGICDGLLDEDYVIDRDPANGEVRGVLHRGHNAMLGLAGESVAVLFGAIQYIERTVMGAKNGGK